MEAATVLEPEVAERRRVLWPFVPALVVLGLIGYVVPYGFYQMYRIHSGLVAEFTEVQGFETVETDVHWYPLDTGGTVLLRPLDENGLNEVKAHARQLGYGNGGAAAGRDWIGRIRTDEFDADMFRATEGPDDLITVHVSVFDTDLVIGGPFVLVYGGVLLIAALAAGRAMERAVFRRRDVSVTDLAGP